MMRRALAWMALTLAWLGMPAMAQTVVYLHTDALGSIVAVTDESRNVVERREYEPFGLQITPTVKDGPGYTGHVQDEATGLTYMQQRYYDPAIGRFMSVDPVDANAHTGANFNRYKYALNNPYRFNDPDGRCESISTCQMMRDDLDLMAGRMTREEHAERMEARGGGAVVGLGLLAGGYAAVKTAPVAVPALARFLAQRAARQEAIRQARAQALRGIRSLEKRIEEHQKKIDDFKQNPTVRPGMEGMSPERIQQQQAARIEHLQKEINTFKQNIEKLREVLKR